MKYTHDDDQIWNKTRLESLILIKMSTEIPRGGPAETRGPNWSILGWNVGKPQSNYFMTMKIKVQFQEQYFPSLFPKNLLRTVSKCNEITVDLSFPNMYHLLIIILIKLWQNIDDSRFRFFWDALYIGTNF